ncbi:MAG: TolB family protein, partial [Bacteroidota bacterium]
LETEEFIPLTQTRAWNFQQGCMAHWLGTSPDSLIIFNDLRDDRFVSVIMNVHTREEIKTLPYPVSAVSPNGKEAVSINFSRLRITREDYGYGGQGQDSRKNERFPEDDGLFLVDLETGDKELLVSIADIQEMVPEIPEDGLEYFNHTLFSKDGSKIMWLARAIPERNTTAFVVDRDGSNLQKCFPEGWGGSHFDWLNGDTLMITAKYKEKVYSHVMFTAGRQDYQRLGGGLLDYDGHGTFSPNGKWFITDTYPNGLLEQQLFLMNMDNQAVLPLGRFHQPSEYRSGWRCDLHPRWSPDSDMVGFNSTHNGSRQVYVIHFSH